MLKARFFFYTVVSDFLNTCDVITLYNDLPTLQFSPVYPAAHLHE